MPRSLLTLLFLSLLCTCGPAQLNAQDSEGQDFWFTFPQHRDPGNTKVALISSRVATSGTIEIPGANWSQTFTVAANAVARITLPQGAETLGTEAVTATAVHVVSNDVISLYIHQYFGLRSEASLVLPTPVLGTDYRVMAYTGLPNDNTNYPSTFAVVATEDETLLSILELASDTEGGRPQGASIDVLLDQGEVYQVRASNAAGDLTGTRVTSSAPVSLFGGAAWSGVPDENCRAFDNLLEINYPISQWGRNYLGVPTLRNNGNRYRVMAAEDNTVVTLTEANVETVTLQAGEFRDFDRTDAVSITSTRPVLVAQYLRGRSCNGHPLGIGDPSFFLLNELTQTQDTVTVFNSNFENISENYLNITFRTGDESGILLDGQPLAGPLELSPDGAYTFARVAVSVGSHTVTSAGCGVIVTVYGYGDAESYAYGGGAAFRPINANLIVPGGCLNDSIYFSTGLDTLRFRHRWLLEDGTIDTRESFARLYDQLGDFPVELIVFDECLQTSDTSFRELSITLRQALNASPDARACAGDSLELEAFDLPGASYAWTGPNGLEEETQRIVLNPLQLANDGVYAVVGDVSGCKTFPTEVMVTVDSLPVVTLAGDEEFCARAGEVATIEAGNFAGYAWSTGSLGPSLTVAAEGTYMVTVTDEFGCRASDSLFVDEFCPTRFYVPTAFSPNADGVNDRLTVFATDAVSVSMVVYDRWGGLVFESIPDVPGWDGRQGGEEAAAGIYSVVVRVEGVAENGMERTWVKSGEVVLVR